MNSELKTSIIELMEFLQSKIGDTLIIEDWICTNGRSYDRHQTRYGRIVLTVEEFGIRTSGSIATLSNSQQQIEFRTDSIRYINNETDVLILEINMIDSVWRKIKISGIKAQTLL